MTSPPGDEPPDAGPEDYGAPPEVPEGMMLTPEGLVPCLDEPANSQTNGSGEDLDMAPPDKVLAPHFWDFERLRDYQPVDRVWVVQHRIPAGEVTLLTGPGGLGKSTIAIQLQVCLAARLDWLGYKTIQAPTIGLYCEEDHNELARRFQGVRRRLGVGWRDMANAVYFPLKGQEVLLAHIDRFEGLVEPSSVMGEVKEYITRLGAKLCVLDSLNRLFQGSENDRPSVTGWLRELELLATQTQCAILLLAHPSKSALLDGSGYSGSTAWDSMVRARAYLSYQHIPDPALLTDADRANPILKLAWKKSNYSARSPDIELQISFDDHAPPEEPPIFEHIPQITRDNRALFMHIIDVLNAAGNPPRPTSTGKAKGMYAPSAVYQHKMNRRGGKRQITSEQCVELYRLLMSELGLLRIVETMDGSRHKRETVVTVAPRQPSQEDLLDEIPL